MVNVYLLVAYAFVWGIFMAYAWIIQGREKRLETEIEALRKELGSKERNSPA